ncbi:MAG: hypothetical protein ACYC03_11385 [Acidovorax defluvii]
MTNKFTITFFENSNGVTVGALKCGDKMLLATTHPATIAYALQAMDAESVDIVHNHECVEFRLLSINAPKRLIKIVGKHMPWMAGFLVFSRVDSYTVSIIDKNTDIYLRTAIHFLPKKMVKNQLLTEAPANWKEELKIRKQYIYHPWC